MKIPLLLSILMMSFSAQALNSWIGQPTHAGTGCPAGETSLYVSPDRLQVNLVADNFVAESGRLNGKTIDRKSCNLSIPIQVPRGYQVALTNEISGFVTLDRNAVATFSQELFTAGSRGPIVTRKFRGPVDDDFRLGSGPAQTWSLCGQSTNIRANLSFTTQGEASAMVDEVRFKLRYRRCQ